MVEKLVKMHQPGFDLQLKRLRRSITISGKSQSTLTNYARCLAHMGLHLNCDLLELDDEVIQDYLHFLKRKHHTPSDSFFKHTVYGLRYLFRIFDRKEFQTGKVQFTVKNYRKQGKKETCTLKAPEFLRRFACITCPENRDLTQGLYPHQALWHPSQCLQGNT